VCALFRVPVMDILSLLNSNDLDKYLNNAYKNEFISCIDVLKCALLCAYEGGILIKTSVEQREKKNKEQRIDSADTIFHQIKSSDVDLVTETDIAVEKIIKLKILSFFPNHLFIGEEGDIKSIDSHERKDKFIWIVDPIDGTTNFIHSFPIVTISIGLAYEDENIFGLVFNPLTNELWFAWKNSGAYMKKVDGSIISISTSSCNQINSALISTGFGMYMLRSNNNKAQQEIHELLNIIEYNNRQLMLNCRDIRRIGSAACDLCYVAMGRTDAYYEFGIREWDIAAGLVILHEAGGSSSTVSGMTSYSLKNRNILVACNIKLRLLLNKILIDKDINRLIDVIENK